jgi:hypothetical protein
VLQTIALIHRNFLQFAGFGCPHCGLILDSREWRAPRLGLVRVADSNARCMSLVFSALLTIVK